MLSVSPLRATSSVLGSFVSIVRGKSWDTKSITVAFAWPDCDLFRPGWLLNISRRAKGSVCRRCGERTTLVLTDQQMTLNCFDLNDLREFPPPYTPTFDSHSSHLMHVFVNRAPHNRFHEMTSRVTKLIIGSMTSDPGAAAHDRT